VLVVLLVAIGVYLYDEKNFKLTPLNLVLKTSAVSSSFIITTSFTDHFPIYNSNLNQQAKGTTSNKQTTPL
jgi:hypothetical protein